MRCYVAGPQHKASRGSVAPAGATHAVSIADVACCIFASEYVASLPGIFVFLTGINVLVGISLVP